jgi:lysophospholipase L1-like esterase
MPWTTLGAVPLVRRFLRLLGAITVAGLIFFAAGEALSRTFDLVDRLNHFPRRLFMPSDDPQLPYRMRPGVETDVRDFHVTVNAHGLRGPDFPTHPAPGVRRILVLGDSVAFGEGLRVDQAFPALLEKELDRSQPGRFDVVNAGVEGYNTVAELAYLERTGLGLDPQTIVVCFNLNDYDYAPVLGPLGVLTGDQAARMSARSPANWSEFWLVLRWLVRTGGRTLFARAPAPPSAASGADAQFAPLDRYVSAIRKAYYRSPTDGRWDAMVASLRRMGALARAHGLRLVIAIVPDGDQIDVPAPDLTPQRRLGQVCADADLDCLDLYPDFAAAAGHGTLFRDIMHPNAAGHRIIARRVAQHLALG